MVRRQSVTPWSQNEKRPYFLEARLLLILHLFVLSSQRGSSFICDNIKATKCSLGTKQHTQTSSSTSCNK